jgi:broad specificity phosphatase PhoE
MPTIYLVRHGQVENPKGIIYGRLPGYHLSELGQLQAEAAAEHLAGANLGAVWVSPLERAQETAQAIANRHNIAVVTDDRLTESANTLEGLSRTLLGMFRDPRRWWAFRNPLRPSWGESFSEIKARMLAAIDEAVIAAGGREVAVVSHQTPVLVARAALIHSRRPPLAGLVACETGSVTTVVMPEQGLARASYFRPPARLRTPEAGGAA